MDLLIEIFSEEIPARMQKPALLHAKETFSKILDELSIQCQNVGAYVATRRLTIWADGMPLMTQSQHEERRGPRIGAPDAALQGFLKSTGLLKEQLIEKDGYYFASLSKEGVALSSLIPTMLHRFLDEMPWPKSMRWYNEKTKTFTRPWIRPIRSIACIFKNEPVEFPVEGLNLSTSNITYGHRFLAPESFEIQDTKNYLEDLKKAYVIADFHERQLTLKEALLNQAQQKGLTLQEDQFLLDEVTGLIDYPFAHLGHIEDKFMNLPECVLSTSMRVHQKYFTLKKTSSNTLAPYFGVITNVPASSSNRLMMEGLERVLRARLSDANFFYEVDVKTPLEDAHFKLDAIVFHAKLGSVGDKIKRLQKLSCNDKVKRAALLCKSDLLSHMVGEFPELQGRMGHIYANVQHEDAEVALALEEYYQPQGPFDQIPTQETSRWLSLIDKIDTLTGFIGVGVKPTGSKDPLAIRRTALGIIRLLSEGNWKDIDLSSLIQQAIKAYKHQGVNLLESTENEVFAFLFDRLSVYLRNQNISHDIVEAVLKSTHSKNIWSMGERTKALSTFLQSLEGKALKSAYKRAHGILNSFTPSKSYQSELFEKECEKDLAVALDSLQQEVPKLIETHAYEALMLKLSSLSTIIDKFFDDVEVNTQDENVTLNRKSLLHMFRQTVWGIADFTCLQG